MISFGQLSLTVEENAGQFTMCVVKSTATQFSVSADISITDISTTPILGEFYPVIQFSLTAQQCTILNVRYTDYDPSSIPGTITITSAEDLVCFNGTINDDVLGFEGNEQFRLTLSNPSPSEVFIGQGMTTITIQDNDSQCFRTYE